MPRILFVTTRIGFGHQQVTNLLAAAIRKIIPECSTKAVSYFDFCPPRFELLVKRSSSLRKVLELLQKNNAISIMVDVDGGIRGIPYRLWGYNVRLPRGPAAIVSWSGAALLVVVMMRLPGGGYRMIIEKPLVTDNEKSITISIFEVIKKYIQQDPVQWHWLKYFFSREHEYHEWTNTTNK